MRIDTVAARVGRLAKIQADQRFARRAGDPFADTQNVTLKGEIFGGGDLSHRGYIRNSATKRRDAIDQRADLRAFTILSPCGPCRQAEVARAKRCKRQTCAFRQVAPMTEQRARYR